MCKRIRYLRNIVRWSAVKRGMPLLFPDLKIKTTTFTQMEFLDGLMGWLIYSFLYSHLKGVSLSLEAEARGKMWDSWTWNRHQYLKWEVKSARGESSLELGGASPWLSIYNISPTPSTFWTVGRVSHSHAWPSLGSLRSYSVRIGHLSLNLITRYEFIMEIEGYRFYKIILK